MFRPLQVLILALVACASTAFVVPSWTAMRPAAASGRPLSVRGGQEEDVLLPSRGETGSSYVTAMRVSCYDGLSTRDDDLDFIPFFRHENAVKTAVREMALTCFFVVSV